MDRCYLNHNVSVTLGLYQLLSWVVAPKDKFSKTQSGPAPISSPLTPLLYSYNSSSFYRSEVFTLLPNTPPLSALSHPHTCSRTCSPLPLLHSFQPSAMISVTLKKNLTSHPCPAPFLHFLDTDPPTPLSVPLLPVSPGRWPHHVTSCPHC